MRSASGADLTSALLDDTGANLNAKAQFDPYHKWFGIPAHEQPPNHYRLLRIDRLESDPEVIEIAYYKEMADLKAQEHGQHADFVDRLSRELISARNCLLDVNRKTTYDATIRAQQESDEVGRQQVEQSEFDKAVQKSLTGLWQERNRLQALAEEASARQRSALLTVKHLQRQLRDNPAPPAKSRRNGFAAIWAFDWVLGKLAGEGNSIIHAALRVSAVLVVLFLNIAGVWWAISSQRANSPDATFNDTPSEPEDRPKSRTSLGASASLAQIIGTEPPTSAEVVPPNPTIDPIEISPADPTNVAPVVTVNVTDPVEIAPADPTEVETVDVTSADPENAAIVNAANAAPNFGSDVASADSEKPNLDVAPDAATAMQQVVYSDPGDLRSYGGQLGKSYLFEVTGQTTGSVWGTGAYTADSSLATAAVHAGVLKANQTGIVKVTILKGLPGYHASRRNGVDSSSWDEFDCSFRVEKSRVTKTKPNTNAIKIQPSSTYVNQLRSRVGENFIFEVTGSTSGSVWGSDVYTDDSSLNAAAVHAGVVREGEKALVKVTILKGQASYLGSTRSGVTSRSYGPFAGSFRVVRFK